MKKSLIILSMCLFMIVSCGDKYMIDTSQMTPEQARIIDLKTRLLEAQDWTRDTLNSYKMELQMRDPVMRKTIHTSVKPVLDGLLLALNGFDVSLSLADGVTAAGEYDRYIMFKTQLITQLARFAIKTK